MTSSLQKNLGDYLASATVVTGLLMAAFVLVIMLHFLQAAISPPSPAADAGAGVGSGSVQTVAKSPHGPAPILS